MSKLYLITRRDLSPGAQAAQLVHAAIDFCDEYKTSFREWYENSNTIVLLSVKNIRELEKLRNRALELYIKCSSFYEPDLDDQLTAIALEPTENAKILCKNLQLALTNMH